MFIERREHLIRMKNKFLTKYLCITLISAMVLSSSAAVWASEETLTSENQWIENEPTDTMEPTIPVVTQLPTEEQVILTPTPGLEDSTPGQENPTPGLEDPTPGLEDPTPGLEDPTPGLEDPTPGLEDPSPSPEEPSPTPEEPSPGETTPTPGETTPGPEEPSQIPTVTPQETPTPELSPTVSPTPTPLPVLTEDAKRVIDKINTLMGVRITLEMSAKIQEIRSDYNKLTDEEKFMVTNYQSFIEMEKALSDLEV